MTAEELKNEMRNFDQNSSGKVYAEWSEGFHFWWSIYQRSKKSKRTYSFFYVDYDGNVEESWEYESLEKLFKENRALLNGNKWQRCKDLKNQ